MLNFNSRFKNKKIRKENKIDFNIFNSKIIFS